MMIKLISLNIWRNNDWEKRESNIIQFFKNENPDVILLQEAVKHPSLEKDGNQVEILKEKIQYSYALFYKSEILTDKITGEKFDIGLGILSKHKILNSESIILKKQPEDKHPRIIVPFVIEKDGKKIELVNVHFSNDEVFSILHLEETLNTIRKNNLKPIICGDFNMRIKEFVLKLGFEYNKSIQLMDYITFPSKNEFLDHFFVHKDLWNFSDFKVSNTYLSDHNAIITSLISNR